MSNADVVRASVDALNAHDVDRAAECWAPGLQERFPNVALDGAEAAKAFFRETFAAIPDLHIDPQALAEDGDAVFLRWVITGTHSGGPWNGIAPTGRRVEINGVDHFTVRDGRIVSNFVIFDQMEVGRQLGLLPPDDSAPDKALKAAFNGVTALRKRLARA